MSCTAKTSLHPQPSAGALWLLAERSLHDVFDAVAQCPIGRRVICLIGPQNTTVDNRHDCMYMLLRRKRRAIGLVTDGPSEEAHIPIGVP